MSKAGFILLGMLLCSLARGNHPLLTEDTAVLGKGRWQIELHGERARDREGGITLRSTAAGLALAHGVTQNADLQLELPYFRVLVDDGSSRQAVKGSGDVELAVKWRFYEREDLSILFKPVLTLPTGDKDLGQGDRAHFGLDFVAAKEIGDLELIGHAGYLNNRNRLDERSSLWHLSFALRWAASEKLKLVADFSRDTHPDAAQPAPRAWVYGLAYAVTDDIDLGFGVKNGINEAAEDRALLAGVKLRW